MRLFKDLLLVLTATLVSANVIADPSTTLAKSKKASVSQKVATSVAPAKKKSLAQKTNLIQPAKSAKTKSGADINQLIETAETMAAKPASPASTEQLMESVLPEGAQFIVGDEKGEFFVVAKDSKAPKIETAEEKVQAAMIANETATQGIEDTAKLINKIKESKLEKALSENTEPLHKQAQKIKVVSTALKQPVSTMEAENKVKAPALTQLAEYPSPTPDVTPSEQAAPQSSEQTQTPATDQSTEQAPAQTTDQTNSQSTQEAPAQSDQSTSQPTEQAPAQSDQSTSQPTEQAPAQSDESSSQPAAEATEQTAKPEAPASTQPATNKASKHKVKKNTKEKHKKTVATRHGHHAKTATVKPKAAAKHAHHPHGVTPVKSTSKHQKPAKASKVKQTPNKKHVSLGKTEKSVKYHHQIFKVKRVDVTD
jgi:hypothetical protein